MNAKRGSRELERQAGQDTGSEAEMRASAVISVLIQRFHIVCPAKLNKEEKIKDGHFFLFRGWQESLLS